MARRKIDSRLRKAGKKDGKDRRLPPRSSRRVRRVPSQLRREDFKKFTNLRPTFKRVYADNARFTYTGISRAFRRPRRIEGHNRKTTIWKAISRLKPPRGTKGLYVEVKITWKDKRGRKRKPLIIQTPLSFPYKRRRDNLKKYIRSGKLSGEIFSLAKTALKGSREANIGSPPVLSKKEKYPKLRKMSITVYGVTF